MNQLLAEEAARLSPSPPGARSAGLVPEEPVVDLLNGSMFMKTAPACPPRPAPAPGLL